MKIPVTLENAVAVLMRERGWELRRSGEQYAAWCSGRLANYNYTWASTPAEAALRALHAAGITEVEEPGE